MAKVSCFYSDAQTGMQQVTQALSSGMTPEEAVRHLRNDLHIEGVALVDVEGTIIAATSNPLVGSKVDNPVLQYALASGRFGAVGRAH